MRIRATIRAGAVLLAVGWALQADAQPNDGSACRVDAQKLCPDAAAARDKPAVRVCLLKQRDKTSPRCRALLDKVQAETGAAKPN